jgi:hypothetical protein
MKRILGLVCGIALVAPLAFGQTNVLSQNAVGYVKVTIPDGGLALVRHDFEALDPAVSNTMKNLIGDQLPNDSVAYIWDVSSGYVIETKGGRSGDWPANGREVFRGEAFWLQVPPASGQAEWDVYLMGEVPGANNGSESSTVTGINNVDAVGYPFPAAVVWGTTSLANDLPNGSEIFFWDIDGSLGANGGAGQGYVSYAKGGRSGDWGTEGNNVVIEPGTAFWVLVGDSSTIDWTETKPYTWP